jgi:hypothetical protein
MSSNEIRIVCGNVEDLNAPVVFGDEAKFTALFSGATPITDTTVVDKQFNRGGATVERYPGDPNPFNRAGSTVNVSRIPARGQQTTPGRPFTVEFPLNINPGFRRTVRQFTLLGTWSNFHAYASTNAKIDLIIRSPGGKPATINVD